MGTFRYRIVIHGAKGKSARLKVLVDTGATYTWIPSDALRRLGVKPMFRQGFRLADGTVIERDAGEARVEIDGSTRTTIVVFGDDGSEPLLGAFTLEGFSLAPDPVLKRLVPVTALMMGLRARKGERG